MQYTERATRESTAKMSNEIEKKKQLYRWLNIRAINVIKRENLMAPVLQWRFEILIDYHD